MPEFYGRVVTCEPVGRFLRMSTIKWKDGLGVAENSFPKSEFIRSTAAYFHPVWSASAPDGSLVFADMYRGIIQEKDYFPTDESDRRQERVLRYLIVYRNALAAVPALLKMAGRPAASFSGTESLDSNGGSFKNAPASSTATNDGE